MRAITGVQLALFAFDPNAHPLAQPHGRRLTFGHAGSKSPRIDFDERDHRLTHLHIRSRGDVPLLDHPRKRRADFRVLQGLTRQSQLGTAHAKQRNRLVHAVQRRLVTCGGHVHQ